MKILNHKDAINRRQDKGLIIVETAIYRVFWLNRTVLGWVEERNPIFCRVCWVTLKLNPTYKYSKPTQY
ncbi:hypothetical protein LC613_05140 [Nostoc sphaeroides CHAB 2801]|uniref:hypothetical protein n=1 Tax=Nostoc sphaeroides TaxID=446679 RepID=UPI0011C0FF19|nr:hypothetical protein [Nostoc sphaeroides]MCC5627567.1 hypothetical protein [Nostoc sphaeroides CHAB 2801]